MHPAYIDRIKEAKSRANAAKTKEAASIWRYIADVLQELGLRTERLEREAASYQRLYDQLLEEAGHTARSQPNHQSKPIAPL